MCTCGSFARIPPSSVGVPLTSAAAGNAGVAGTECPTRARAASPCSNAVRLFRRWYISMYALVEDCCCCCCRPNALGAPIDANMALNTAAASASVCTQTNTMHVTVRPCEHSKRRPRASSMMPGGADNVSYVGTRAVVLIHIRCCLHPDVPQENKIITRVRHRRRCCIHQACLLACVPSSLSSNFWSHPHRLPPLLLLLLLQGAMPKMRPLHSVRRRVHRRAVQPQSCWNSASL